MKRLCVLFTLLYGILLSFNAVAAECKIPLLQLRTSDPTGVHIYDVEKLSLDFCTAEVTCQGWSGTPVYEVEEGLGCTQHDKGYVTCDWKLPVSLKISYYQNGAETRIKVQDDHNRLTFATGISNQRRPIQTSDFLVTVTTSDICPDNVATR